MTRGAIRGVLLAALVVLLIGICVYFGTTRWKTELKVPLIDGSTTTVMPGVHLIGGLGPAAAYVVETSDGLVLIDAGLEADAQLLKTEMIKLNLDRQKLRAIFLTHVHGDHCGGAEELRAETGAKIHAGKGDAPLLQAGQPRDAFFSTFKMPGHSPHPTTVDVALQGNETITIGDAQFQVLGTPGHTAGSTCYLMERGDRRVLFSGDVIFRLGDKPLGTYSTYLAPKYGGNAQTYLVSLRKLRALQVPDLVLPGHPAASRGPHSPRLSQQRWDEMLDEGISDMEKLIGRYKSGGANFLDGQPKRLLPDLYYLGDFQGAAVYGFFAGSQFVLIDAPGGPGLAEFLKQQLQVLGLKPAEPTVVLLTACGEQETAGLKELIERHKVQVVASAAGVEAIKNRCPPDTTILSADDLKAKGWFNVTPIPLGGRGVAPIAYALRWTDKTVLFSGKIPAIIDQQSRPELLADLLKSKQHAIDYVNSLRQFATLQPDLWLPLIPLDAPNASLFDSAWKGILEQNYRVANELLEQR